MQNAKFVNANYNTKFIENNLNLFLEKKKGVESLVVNEEATIKLRSEKKIKLLKLFLIKMN